MLCSAVLLLLSCIVPCMPEPEAPLLLSADCSHLYFKASCLPAFLVLMVSPSSRACCGRSCSKAQALAEVFDRRGIR